MASDGSIDPREIEAIRILCNNSELFNDFNFQEEINVLVDSINANGKEFISSYFELLKNTSLQEKEELILIDFAIQTIKADEQIEYGEIKFFKNIRHRLKVDDEKILSIFPDIEQFLEEDIITESFLDRITNQYLEAMELPQFKSISTLDTKSLEDLTKNE